MLHPLRLDIACNIVCDWTSHVTCASSIFYLQCCDPKTKGICRTGRVYCIFGAGGSVSVYLQRVYTMQCARVMRNKSGDQTLPCDQRKLLSDSHISQYVYSKILKVIPRGLASATRPTSPHIIDLTYIATARHMM